VRCALQLKAVLLTWDLTRDRGPYEIGSSLHNSVEVGRGSNPLHPVNSAYQEAWQLE
jgi:hypothetical protein